MRCALVRRTVVAFHSACILRLGGKTIVISKRACLKTTSGGSVVLDTIWSAVKSTPAHLRNAAQVRLGAAEQINGVRRFIAQRLQPEHLKFLVSHQISV